MWAADSNMKHMQYLSTEISQSIHRYEQTWSPDTISDIMKEKLPLVDSFQG